MEIPFRNTNNESWNHQSEGNPTDVRLLNRFDVANSLNAIIPKYSEGPSLDHGKYIV